MKHTFHAILYHLNLIQSLTNTKLPLVQSFHQSYLMLTNVPTDQTFAILLKLLVLSQLLCKDFSPLFHKCEISLLFHHPFQFSIISPLFIWFTQEFLRLAQEPLTSQLHHPWLILLWSFILVSLFHASRFLNSLSPYEVHLQFQGCLL